jgi:hypothetical protein
MASYTCPKCNIILKKGSWELVTECPDCKTPWVNDPQESMRKLRRVHILATVFAVLSFVPFLGLVFGALGVFWGYLAIKFRHVALGLVMMVVSTVVGLVGNTALLWYQLGQFGDHHCEMQLATLGSSIKAYREKSGHFPESMDALKKAKLETPKRCFAGGTYVYLPPWNWKVGSGATTTAPATIEVEVLGAMTQPATAPAVHAPAPSEPTVPLAWASGVPTEYQAAFHAAKYEVATLPMPKAIAEASNPSTLVMVTELNPAHRYEVYCMMADFSVRSMTPEAYEKLMQQPQNRVFAQVLLGARMASNDPKIGKAAKKIAEEKAKQSGKQAPAAPAVEPVRGPGH